MYTMQSDITSPQTNYINSVAPSYTHSNAPSMYATAQGVQKEEVKYIEVPVVQEVIRKVPKKEIVEVERKVPVIDYQYVDKVVEVPQIHYVDKIVEVPQVHEVIRRVPVTEIIEVPKEIIKHVPKIETKIVEKIVEVPGEVIEVPKHYQVENKIVLPSYVKKEVPTIVSQQLIPTIYESETDIMEVTVNEYVPKMIPVDVFVPKPISRQLIAEKIGEKHNIVDVPAAQWNALVINANPHISNESDLKDIMITNGDMVPTLQGPGTQIVEPRADMSELARRTDEEMFQIRVTPESKQQILNSVARQHIFSSPTVASHNFVPTTTSQQFATTAPHSHIYPQGTTVRSSMPQNASRIQVVGANGQYGYSTQGHQVVTQRMTSSPGTQHMVHGGVVHQQVHAGMSQFSPEPFHQHYANTSAFTTPLNKQMYYPTSRIVHASPTPSHIRSVQGH